MQMSVKIISRKLDARPVTIKLVDGSLVQGQVNLHHDEAVVQRVSDIFTKLPDPFIVVFEATAEGQSGRVLILNKSNIIWVSPEDDGRSRREADSPPEAPPDPGTGDRGYS
jgi:small nuclear ribonucleoprotein (snRNP)-like protein